MRYRQEKECTSFVFFCFENLSIGITLEPLHGPIQVEFSAKCSSSNEDFNQIEH